MAIDPRIAMGFQAPQIASPMDLAQNAFALKGAMQQNALAEAKMSEMQRQQQSQNALRQLFAGGKMPNAAAVYAIDPELGGAYEKGQADIRKSRADADISYWNQQRDTAARLGDQASWSAWRNTLPAEFQGFVPQQYNPENKRMTLATADAALKRTLQQVDTGGGGYTLEIPELGGPATKVQGSEYTKTLSPDQIADNASAFDPDRAVHVATDENGNIRFFNARGGEVNPGAGKGAGKPSGAVITARQKGEKLKGDINNVISEFERILKPGGLLDQSTGSGAGAMVDAVAGFGGVATEGAIAIGQLQPVADLSLKLVERFEGPQSDSDRISYKEASANVANASLPIPIRKAAAATVLRILKKRRDQFGYRDADGSVVTGGTAPSTSGGSDIDALVNKHRTQ
jgi:hypothetical protein